MMPRLRQFIEFLWCLVYVNLQRFYDAHFLHFTDILQSPVYVLLQTFYRARYMPF